MAMKSRSQIQDEQLKLAYAEHILNRLAKMDKSGFSILEGVIIEKALKEARDKISIANTDKTQEGKIPFTRFMLRNVEKTMVKEIETDKNAEACKKIRTDLYHLINILDRRENVPREFKREYAIKKHLNVHKLIKTKVLQRIKRKKASTLETPSQQPPPNPPRSDTKSTGQGEYITGDEKVSQYESSPDLHARNGSNKSLYGTTPNLSEHADKALYDTTPDIVDNPLQMKAESHYGPVIRPKASEQIPSSDNPLLIQQPQPLVFHDVHHAKSQNIAEYLKQKELTPEQKCDLAIKIVEKVSELHENNKHHGDLGVHTIVVENGKPSILQSPHHGTLITNGKESAAKSDVHALGKLFKEVLNIPEKALNFTTLSQAIMQLRELKNNPDKGQAHKSSLHH